jgi:hypothetical protein
MSNIPVVKLQNEQNPTVTSNEEYIRRAMSCTRIPTYPETYAYLLKHLVVLNVTAKA